jgi:hypothetical protein
MTDHVEDKRGEAEAHLNCGDKQEATTTTISELTTITQQQNLK